MSDTQYRIYPFHADEGKPSFTSESLLDGVVGGEIDFQSARFKQKHHPHLKTIKTDPSLPAQEEELKVRVYRFGEARNDGTVQRIEGVVVVQKKGNEMADRREAEELLGRWLKENYPNPRRVSTVEPQWRRPATMPEDVKRQGWGSKGRRLGQTDKNNGGGGRERY